MNDIFLFFIALFVNIGFRLLVKFLCQDNCCKGSFNYVCFVVNWAKDNNFSTQVLENHETLAWPLFN